MLDAQLKPPSTTLLAAQRNTLTMQFLIPTQPIIILGHLLLHPTQAGLYLALCYLALVWAHKQWLDDVEALLLGEG